MTQSAPDFDGLRPACERLTGFHDDWRNRVREFVDENIVPRLDAWEAAGGCDDALYRQAADAGLLGMGFPTELGGIGDTDIYHRVIFAEEMHRTGSGLVFADLATLWIGLPPVVSTGDPSLAEEVVRPVLRGERKIAFAVTEPTGGSDVGAIRTAARRDGDGYRVKGTKTLVSGGLRADYVLTAVRTGGPGIGGLSLLLVDTAAEGVSRSGVPGLAWYCASNATIEFDDAFVPRSRLIGPEDKGFIALLPQFNLERFSGIAAARQRWHCRVWLYLRQRNGRSSGKRSVGPSRATSPYVMRWSIWSARFGPRTLTSITASGLSNRASNRWRTSAC